MTNSQEFYEKSRKMGFPRIIKVNALQGKMKKDFDSWKERRKRNNIDIKDDDLVIVRVTVWTQDKEPEHYSFEKIIGAPIEYLLKTLWDTEEKEEEWAGNSPFDD